MSIAVFALALLLQVPPPGAQNPAAVKPTGRIAGQVTDAATGKPLGDGTLRLIRWEGGRGTQAAGRTDSQGRFEFHDLPPGSYQLTVAVDRYVGLEFGQRVPTEPGKRIELSDGQQFDKADIALSRTGAIEGRLIDEFGDPVPGVTVQIARVTYAAGKTRLMPATGVTVRPTDDLGRFRMFNLPPGDYYVLALAGPFASTGADDPSGFAPTYFPGTRIATQAQAVHLGYSQDLGDISFPLMPAPMETVSGVVVDASGQPVPKPSVLLMQTNGGDVRAMIMARLAGEADGTFVFRNVAPGSYVIQAFGQPQGGGSLASSPFGSRVLTLAESNVSDLVVRISSATARGHISFEGAAPLPTTASVRIAPTQVEFVSSPIMGGGFPPNVIRDDWTFEVSNMNGRRVVRVNIGSSVWMLKRVTLDGKDVTDEPVDFTQGDVNGLEITLTSNAAMITGTVTDNGAPATNYGVVVFAEDSAKWAWPSRFLAVAGMTQGGGFRVAGLPAGAYRVVALPANELADAQDPAVLSKLVVFATSVLVSDGETQTIALKLIKR